MSKIDIKSKHESMLSDLMTPVGLFLKVRRKYKEVLLLESSDYSSKEDSLSFLCFDSHGHMLLKEKQATYHGSAEALESTGELVADVEQFVDLFNHDDAGSYNGVFGYSSFDCIQHFESIRFNPDKSRSGIPILRYDFFRFIVVFDHFHEQLHLIENSIDGQASQMESIRALILDPHYETLSFSLDGEIESNMTDDYFKNIVTKSKSHCQRGDIFQMVPSRRFSQGFKGDDFNVYRALRSINPSPYLFYFDYEDYKIFGSSPEAQMIVKDRVAEIHPIAGTFKRTGDLIKDNELARQLLADPKENAEHIMLVDLARNDLSKNTDGVKVHKYKEVQYFSHVIHLVSVVKGKLKPDISCYQIFADTFPAGTLSGAPKYKALELIDEFEPTGRSYYGGGIGMISFNGDLNHAIMIRSFLSENNTLFFQAGAGIVIDSEEEKELQEVNNKLAALKKALEYSEKISIPTTI